MITNNDDNNWRRKWECLLLLKFYLILLAHIRDVFNEMGARKSREINTKKSVCATTSGAGKRAMGDGGNDDQEARI